MLTTFHAGGKEGGGRSTGMAKLEGALFLLHRHSNQKCTAAMGCPQTASSRLGNMCMKQEKRKLQQQGVSQYFGTAELHLPLNADLI